MASLYLLGANFQYVFDKSKNLFMKIKLGKDEEQPKVKFQIPLDELIQIKIRSTRNRNVYHHVIYFRRENASKVKFFHIGYNNSEQIRDYISYLQEFLQLDYVPTTRLARKYFTI